jgi:EAL domain-containing protein (putative c-di-GMP-specific phosphodiesterase class I)
LAENHFEAWFQPIMAGRMAAVKAEALLRWHHPEMASACPASSLPWQKKSA